MLSTVRNEEKWETTKCVMSGGEGIHNLIQELTYFIEQFQQFPLSDLRNLGSSPTVAFFCGLGQMIISQAVTLLPSCQTGIHFSPEPQKRQA